MANWYCSREAAKAAGEIAGPELDAQIDRLIEGAARFIDQKVGHSTRDPRRFFIPRTRTNVYPWPGRGGRGSVLYTGMDLLSVTTLQAKAQDSSPTTIGSSDFFLEPANQPPYHRIEIDLSSSAAFEGGDTPQRSISVLGSWGYSDDRIAASAINDATPMNASVTMLIVDEGILINVGDTLLIESEQIFVTDRGGGHRLIVERGVNGTTAAIHADDTAITKFEPPKDIVGWAIAEALFTLKQEQVAWGRTLGTGEGAREPGRGIEALRRDMIAQYAWVREAAI